MPDPDYAFLVLSIDENDEAAPVVVCMDESVAQELAQRIGGRVDQIIILGLER